MKIFTKEDGKDVVYIQYGDLRILSYSERTPDNIKKLIPIGVYSLIYSEKYMKFDNEEFIEWVRNTYFILDFDQFSKMSKNEIYREYVMIESRIELILSDLKKFPKRERKNQIGMYQAYEALIHYKNQILKFLQSEKLALPDGKNYIYKK